MGCVSEKVRKGLFKKEWNFWAFVFLRQIIIEFTKQKNVKQGNCKVVGYLNSKLINYD